MVLAGQPPSSQCGRQDSTWCDSTQLLPQKDAFSVILHHLFVVPVVVCLSLLDETITLVDQATSDILNSVDWSANLQLVDQVNANDNPPMLREIVHVLRKRLQSKTPRVVMNALTLAETLVLNCHTRFHNEVAESKFMNAMSNVARVNSRKMDRTSVEIADKALELIQSWGEVIFSVGFGQWSAVEFLSPCPSFFRQAFRPQHEVMPLFADTYDGLRKEGLCFHAGDAKPPVFMPPPSSDTTTAAYAAESVAGCEPANGFRNGKEVAAEASLAASALKDKCLAAERWGAEQRDAAAELADRCATLQLECMAQVRRSGGDEDHLLQTNDSLNDAIAHFQMSKPRALRSTSDLVDVGASESATSGVPRLAPPARDGSSSSSKNHVRDLLAPPSEGPCAGGAAEEGTPHPFLGLTMAAISAPAAVTTSPMEQRQNPLAASLGNPFDALETEQCQKQATPEEFAHLKL